MSVTNVLAVTACGYLEGDIKMLLLGLHGLDSTKTHIHVVSPPRGAVYEYLAKLPNVTVHTMEMGGIETANSSFRLWFRRLYSLATIPRIAALVKQAEIDVIYTVDRTVGMHISYAVSRLTGCPLMLCAQHYYYLEYNSFIHQLLIHHASCITVLSESMRQQFLPYVNDPTKLIVVHNAIDVESFEHSRDRLTMRSELGLEPSVPLVALVGRIDPWKGQAELIRAAAIVLDTHPEAIFLLVGRGDSGYVREMEQLVKELEVEKNILFLGYRNDIPDILSMVDIATMPSYHEPFGLVAIEAMAMGKPVIATKAGAVPEFIVDGEMGLLIPPRDVEALADALTVLLDNPDRASQMGSQGRKHVAHSYSARRYQQKIEQLFKQFARDVNFQPEQI